ncbi:MAG TPA: putative ABC transporter permease [Bacilli bacterium]|nr:putative ABC transporter permease [Bacilli bacterium]
MYTLQNYILIFFIVSIIGWLMETLLNYIETKKIVDRGFLLGPYCPIYGTGVLIIILFLSKYENDLIVLYIMSTLMCSVLEYVTSYAMEKMFNARWWDYSQIKYNLNGRICLTNSLLFGLGGLLVVIFIAPFLVHMINYIPVKTQNIVANILLIIYLIDNIISFGVVLRFRKLNYKFKEKKDNTEEISVMIKHKIESSFFIKKIMKAYPSIKNKFNEIMNELNKKIDDIDIMKKHKKKGK